MHSLSRISLQGGEGVPESLSISSSSVNVCSDVGEEAIRGDTENALDQNSRLSDEVAIAYGWF